MIRKYCDKCKREMDQFGCSTKELNQEQLDFWYNNLKQYDTRTYRRAIGEYAKENRYMPAISDILLNIKKLKPLEPQTNVARYDCKACNGTGYVLYHKLVNGISYEYIAQCNCPNGIGKEYDGRKCKEKPTDYFIPKAEDVFCGGAV